MKPASMRDWVALFIAAVAARVRKCKLIVGDPHCKCRSYLAALSSIDLQTSELRPAFALEVTNVGRKSVVVSGLALRGGGTTKEYYFLSPNLPKLLQPRNSVSVWIDLGGLPSDVKALYVHESTGIEWRLPRRQLKELLKHQKSAAAAGKRILKGGRARGN